MIHPSQPFAAGSVATTLRAPAACRLSPAIRRAFTLVELLIVVAILAVLASMVLFALAGAEGTAKELRTRSTIDKLSNLIMQKYESYRTRRVPIVVPSNTMQRPIAFAGHRLNALREIMRFELPDRFTDIIDIPVTSIIYNTSSSKISRPSASASYLRVLNSTPTKTTEYQGAECLYLIISRGIDDPDVMEQFNPSEIGDTDQDGLQEFLDAWGKPISFLRWPAGFVSTLQPKSQTSAPYSEHDPFDPVKVHKPLSSGPTYWSDFYNSGVHPPLYPLIYSAGADGEYDIFTDSKNTPFQYSLTPAPFPNNPYIPVDNALFGSVLDPSDGDQSIDNITNHDLGTGPG
ncbi:MAG: type II secretion system protein [Pirellulales bacterium]|nr:type II secretion system protein [Pirellulales bacterium]